VRAVLVLTGVVSGYGGSDILQGVDLEVDEGSVTCVVGPNGAGKSTVLRTVSGLLRPKAGSIMFAGREIAGLSPAEILSSGISQVPQSGGLFPHLTVRENVLMGAYVVRRDAALVRQRYREVREMVPLLSERAGDRAGNLSGGQRRLIEFARCLMLDPKVLLLDEPSLGLDPKSLRQVFSLIGEMRDRGLTLVLVEQNVRLGLAVASHAVVMEGGRVRLTGAPGDVLDNPQIAELYLGGTIHTEGGGAPVEGGGVADRAAP
jgi:branched-chain amino acid transport system ATP-binding protein